MSISAPLLAWYDAHHRDLPWRRTSDAWAILVSEVMLQQTRVEVVDGYWRRFMARFPAPRDLAEADEEELLAMWAGLGYYRRARNLQRAAETIVREHGGRFPEEFDAILALPGVGRYTAGAVASIALGQAAPLVDGNVSRVFSRLYRIAGDPTKGPALKRHWALAEELLDPTRPGDYNQALMELGALVCRPKSPHCLQCPLTDRCASLRDSVVDRYPAPRQRKETVEVRLAALRIERRGAIGLIKRAPGQRMAGLFDLPSIELGADDDAARQLTRWMQHEHGLSIGDVTAAGETAHGITHHKIRAEVFRTSAVRKPRRADARAESAASDTTHQHGIAPRADELGIRFFLPDEVAEIGLSALARKMLSASE